MVSLRQGIVIGSLAALVTFLAPAAPKLISNTTYAQQPASPRTNTIDRKIEHVPYTEYRSVIEQNDQVVVLYYVSTKDINDEFRTQHSQNQHGLLFIEWLANNYGDTFEKYAIVDLPDTKSSGEILRRETGLNRYPSVVIYRKGQPVTRIRGPPTDKDKDDVYKRFIDLLKKDGFEMKG